MDKSEVLVISGNVACFLLGFVVWEIWWGMTIFSLYGIATLVVVPAYRAKSTANADESVSTPKVRNTQPTLPIRLKKRERPIQTAMLVRLQGADEKDAPADQPKKRLLERFKKQN